MREHVRTVERAIVAALARGAPIDADAQRFLLRLSRLDGRDDLAEMVGGALAQALAEYGAAASVRARAAWLTLFVDARRFSDDERLDDAIRRLTGQLREERSTARVADAAAALDATLRAAGLSGFRSIASPAVDELERLIATHYRPGQALGSITDQVKTASALLTAYGLSGRLAYPMLAEEVMQFARGNALPGFTDACEAACVWCGLAALHADESYRASAVVVRDVDYRGDATRVLTDLSAEAVRRGPAGGIYGIALLELESASLLP